MAEFVVFGYGDSAVAGAQLALSLILQGDDRVSLNVGGAQGVLCAEGVDLQPIECAWVSMGALRAVASINAILKGAHCNTAARDAVATVASKVASRVAVIPCVLKFTPEEAANIRFAHVATTLAVDRLPDCLRSKPLLPTAIPLRDEMLNALLMVLRGAGWDIILIAVSSTASSTEALEELRGVTGAVLGFDLRLNQGLVVKDLASRYTDALVETNGFFLYT